MATQFPITSGPSKWDLVNGLFNRKPHHIVTFGTNAPVFTSVEIVVTSVQAEDDSDESWNIEGYVTNAWRPRHTRHILIVPESGLRVFAQFRTDERSGSIRFFEKQTSTALEEIDEIVRRTNEMQFGDGRPVRR